MSLFDPFGRFRKFYVSVVECEDEEGRGGPGGEETVGGPRRFQNVFR